MLALVSSFPTNLVSSNSEFVCKSCGRLNFTGSRISLPSAGARGHLSPSIVTSLDGPGARGHPGRSLSSSDHPGCPGSWTRVPGFLCHLLSAPSGCPGLRPLGAQPPYPVSFHVCLGSRGFAPRCSGLYGIFLCSVRVPGSLLSGCLGWRLCATATFFLGVFISPSSTFNPNPLASFSPHHC